MKFNIYYFYFAFFFSLFVSCSNSQEKEIDCYGKYRDCSIVPYFYQPHSEDGVVVRNTHYLLVNNYKSECFNQYHFLHLALNYLDTVTTHLPVWEITFINDTKNFPKSPDNQHWNLVTENFIISYYFTKNDDTVMLNSITFWVDGDYYDIEFKSNR